jgi:hypothetical protein
MRKVNCQSDERRPLSAYILIAAVIVLDLSLVYLVNVDLLPFVFDIDRELYRQSLIDMVIQITTTALGVFLGMLCFHLFVQSQQKSDANESQQDFAQGTQGDNRAEEEQGKGDTT